MSSIKSMLIIFLLGGISYAVYLVLTTEPPGPPPEGLPDDWADAPKIEIPEMGPGGTPATMLPVEPPGSGHSSYHADPSAPLGDAPAFGDPATAGDAPRYQPESAMNSPSDAPPFNAGLPAVPNAGGDAPAFEAQSPAPAVSNPTAFPPESAPSASTDPGMENSPGYSYDTMTSSDVAAADTPAASFNQEMAAADPAAVPEADTAGIGENDFAAAMDGIRKQLEQGDIANAHLELSRWYDDPRLSAVEHQDLMRILDRVAGTVVYSNQHNLLVPAYVVQPGDTLQSIGEKFQVPWQLLAKINGVAPAQLQIGSELKVVPGPFDAVVDLDEYLLTLYVQGRYAGRFRIGVGQENSTPVGEYVVQQKLEDPVYYGPDQQIAADDPANPLGERWIDLGNGLGIHGTNNPESIGKAESQGCVRLSPVDVADVYDILSVGSRVVIRR